MIHESIEGLLEPVYSKMYSALPLILIFIGIVLFFRLSKKIKSAIIFRKYKGKNKKTNNWFDWGEYNERFAIFQDRERAKAQALKDERIKKRAESRHPKTKTQTIQNNS